MAMKSLSEFNSHLLMNSSPQTARVYTHAVKHYLTYCNGNAPTPQNAQKYIDSLNNAGLQPTTLSMRRYALISWFKFNGKSIELTTPKIHMNEPKYLTKDELAKILSACKSPRDELLISMLYDTAVRISELLNVNINDIDFEHSTMKVTRKGGDIMRVNISKRVVDKLTPWCEMISSVVREKTSTSKIFPGMEYGDAYIAIRNIGKMAGINVNPHIFRHSRAIHMLQAGTPMHIVQQHLGHKNINTTASIYGRFTVQDLKKEIPDW